MTVTTSRSTVISIRRRRADVPSICFPRVAAAVRVSKSRLNRLPISCRMQLSGTHLGANGGEMSRTGDEDLRIVPSSRYVVG
jgi:hypothetical protein